MNESSSFAELFGPSQVGANENGGCGSSTVNTTRITSQRFTYRGALPGVEQKPALVDNAPDRKTNSGPSEAAYPNSPVQVPAASTAIASGDKSFTGER